MEGGSVSRLSYSGEDVVSTQKIMGLGLQPLCNHIIASVGYRRHPPMDYDDAEFQGHNPQLAEGNSKLSSVLQPYPLPKFDFDDSLQGHLRFDSLVENEVFLGIPSQEDNHWIEDFSRGSSEIEFNSSATESCAIARRNNVWSEATSSESVEMLLKSVGQEEKVFGELINGESDTGNELDNLTKEMEHSSKQDDKMENAIYTEPESAPIDFPSVECTSEALEEDPPIGGNLTKASNISDAVIKGNVGVDRNCDDANQMELEISVTECVVENMKEPTSISGEHIGNINSSPQNVNANSPCMEFKDQENKIEVADVSFESVDVLINDKSKVVVGEDSSSKQSNMVGKILSVTVDEICINTLEHSNMVDKLSSVTADEICTNEVEGPQYDTLKGMVDDNHDVDGSKQSDMLEQILKQTANETCMKELGDPVDVASGMESVVEHNNEINITKFSEPSGSAVKEDDDCQIAGRCKDAANSAEPQDFDIVNVNDGPEISKHSQSSINEDLHLVYLEDAVSKKQGVEVSNNSAGTSSYPELEMVVEEKDNDLGADHGTTSLEGLKAELPTEVSNMDCGVVGSSCSGEGDVGKTRIANGSECEDSIGNEPEPKVVADDTNLSSFDTLTGGSEAVANEIASHNDGGKLLVLGMMPMEASENEEENTDSRSEASLSDPKKSLQMASDLELLPETGKASQGDQAVFEIGQECSEKCEVCPVVMDSPVKEVENTEAAISEKDEEVLMGRNVQLASEDVAEALLLSDTIEVPADTMVVSKSECCDMSEKSNEVTEVSGTQTAGHTCTSIKVDSANDHQASAVLSCPDHITNCLNEDLDSSVNLAKDDCEFSSINRCTEDLLSEKEQVGIKRIIADNVQNSEDTFDNDGKVKMVSAHLGTDSSFTFVVGPVSGQSEGQTIKDCQSILSKQVHKISMVTEDPAVASGISKIDLKMMPENSCGSPQPHVQEIEGGGATGATERKKRRGSGKAAAKESAKKGNYVKESTPVRQSERDDNSTPFMCSPGTDQLVQSEELKRRGDAEQSGTKSCGVVSISTCNLPDLNSSVSPVAIFQQPFTDLQQVQLRAQIFVYGSLIQESVPDEAYMLSAFGPSDGSRSLWEPAWRACVERVNVQRSRTSSGTPVRSGSKAADKPIKNSSIKKKVPSSPAGRGRSKGTQLPVNPVIPIISPLWNVSTPGDGVQSSGIPRGAPAGFHQPLSPLNPYQVPGIRNFVGHSSSWLPQTSFPGPWFTSPQTTTFDVNGRYSMFPNTEPVKLTPAKDSAVQNILATNHASIITFGHGGGDGIVSSGTSSKLEVEKVPVLTGKHSTDPKPRKRKKVPVAEGPEGPGQIPLPALHQAASVSSPSFSNQLSEKAHVTEGVFHKSYIDQSQTESAPAAVVSNIFSSSVGATTLRITSPTFVSDQPELMGQKLENKSIIADEALNSVEEAKRQAEAAAVHAAATFGHCQDVWSKLGEQQNSGLISDVEAKLASAAVAIAAAASVAKAAAAAAKIASDVAVQAKLMADEVSSSSLTRISNQSAGLSLSRVSTGSGSATHSSILKSGDGSTSASSIIAVAREAARKRVEAASAASRHADILDAIVKAAELASEAVSQAGKIVSIGDPLPLRDLIELGPVGYWKNPKVFSEEGTKSHNVDKDHMNAVNVELHNISVEQSSRRPSVMDNAKKCGTFANLQKDPSRAQRGPRTSELPKPIDVAAESDAGSMPDGSVAEDLYTIASKGSIENEMKEGCFVEVFKDGGHYKAAWYSANILNLKNGKAFLCYSELQEDDGSGQLKEWVPLGGDGINAPTVRVAHPKTTLRFDGSKKRRRAEVMDYNWSVGDRVDAWTRECWREGIVKEKKQNDKTTLMVHFPAHEDTLVVRAWHLRPTLIWQDGEWIEWSGARQHSPSQGDTPQEKRMKLGSPAKEVKGKDKIPSGVDLVESMKHEESSLLPLSASEKEFNVGKITRNDNKVNAQRAMRTGLLKEGSKVVFGIPKPGKKRKFMDVSGHFDSKRSSKNVKASESVKIARYLMPSGSSRGTKIGVKEKQAPEDKLKVVGSRKPPSSSGRALPKNDNFISSKSAPHDASTTEEKLEDSICNEENNASQQNLLEFESFSNSQDTSEGSTLVPSLGLLQVAHNKVPLSNAKSERLNKGKIAPADRRLGKKAELQNPIPEVLEPRRSNRKMQPTSRLLEGLQSSLIISKLPSFPHGRSHRS